MGKADIIGSPDAPRSWLRQYGGLVILAAVLVLLVGIPVGMKISDNITEEDAARQCIGRMVIMGRPSVATVEEIRKRIEEEKDRFGLSTRTASSIILATCDLRGG